VKLNIRRSNVRVLCCVSGTILFAGLTYAATGNTCLLTAGDKAKVIGQAGSSAQAQGARCVSVARGSKQPVSTQNIPVESYSKSTVETAHSAWYQSNASGSSNRNRDDWVHAWLRKVDKVRASQPHFISPIVTTHVLLVQQFRYDMSWQQDSTGNTITANYGASRGLEIIPTTRLEVGIFPPSYFVHQSQQPDGFGDLSFQVKFRAFSATEGKGDYFVGFFLGGSLPTGTPPNGLGHAVLSPTFAAAKGIGPWDIQSTIGANLPTAGTDAAGRMIVFNTAVNYRIKGIIWPMLEQNSTFWSGGTLDGNKEVFLTPGLVLGSFQLAKRLRRYNHRWILSVRFPF
jgi:hypothetical protein